MPFGLCNAPAMFERLMDRVLEGLWWSRCLVHLNDIISFGSTFDSALANLTLIFERLQLKSTKCHLFRSSVPFLGHIVGRDPAKIEDVKSWPVPDCLKECAPVSGICGLLPTLYSEFCRHCDAFSDLDWKRRSICVGRGVFDRLQCSPGITYTRPDPCFPD